MRSEVTPSSAEIADRRLPIGVVGVMVGRHSIPSTSTLRFQHDGVSGCAATLGAVLESRGGSGTVADPNREHSPNCSSSSVRGGGGT